MTINKNKINDNALKFIQKGQVKKAIREYEKILAEDPNDVRTLLKKGDLLVRVGEKSEAVETYLRVASTYSQQGFHLKAVAVFKQILKIDDSRIDVNLRLADEYQNLGIVGDAMSHLQVVATHYDQQGLTRESLDILRRIVDLDPDNIASRIKLAELYSREGMTAEAVEEFSRAATDLKGANRIEDYIKVAERLIYHDSSNIALVKELANIYLQRGDTKRALGKLQICFKADPRDLETLGMLAMAFSELNQLSKTVSVYKEMAKIYSEQGAVGEMEQVYRRVLQIVPDDPEANQMLSGRAAAPSHGSEAGYDETLEQSLPQLTQPTGPTTEMPEMEPPEELAEVEEVLEVPEVPSLREVPYETELTVPEKPQREHLEPAAGGPVSDQAREVVSRLLTETDVYIKYGLQNKALDHLNRVFQLDRNNIEAHEKLKDLYLASDEMENAAGELLTLARLATRRAQTERARGYLRSLLTIFPGHTEGLALARQLEGGAPVAAVEEVGLEAAVPQPAVNPAAPDVIMLDSDSTVEVDELEADLDEDLALDDVPIDVEEDLIVEEEEQEELATMIADRPGIEPAEAEFDLEPEAAGDGADASEDEHQMLDYGGTEETVDANVFTTDVYPAGKPDDFLPEDEQSEPGDAADSLDEPEVLELVEDRAEPLEAIEDDVDGPSALPLEEDVELIDFNDEEEFFAEEELPPVKPARPPPAKPPSRPPAPPPKQAAADEFDGSEMSTMLAERVPIAEPEAAEEAVEEAAEDEVADALEEVDFFLQQNLLDEAADELERLKESYPGHPQVQERLARLSRLQKKEAPAAAPAVPAIQEGTFDLAAEIESEVGDEGAPIPLDEDFQYSFDDVFSEFKKGVEKVVAKEDSSTHFDLGIAYKEMGLIDDAISEFTIASQDAGKKASALTLVGLCLVEQGKYSDAINRFKDALHGPGITDLEATGVYYEMGRTYELLNDPAEALFYFKKVSKRDAKFRDVTARIKALSKSDGGGDKPDKPSGSKSKISYM